MTPAAGRGGAVPLARGARIEAPGSTIVPAGSGAETDVGSTGAPSRTKARPMLSRHGYYEWEHSGPSDNHRYLLPALLSCLPRAGGRRLVDLGCGNGYLTAKFVDAGMDAAGVEGTSSGVARARRSWPGVPFLQHDLAEPLPEHLQGKFDVVVSAEVIEHLHLPRELFARAREALGGAGTVIVSTPFHGYWKNLALALTGRLDAHHQALADYGHIKFFSERTLGAMAAECGFRPVRFVRAGRTRPLAATTVMVGELEP